MTLDPMLSVWVGVFGATVLAAFGVRAAWRRRRAMDALRRSASAGDAAWFEVRVSTVDALRRRGWLAERPADGVLIPNGQGARLRTVAPDGAIREQQIRVEGVEWLGVRSVDFEPGEWLALGIGDVRRCLSVRRSGGTAELYTRLVGAAPTRGVVESDCYSGDVIYPIRRRWREHLRAHWPLLAGAALLYVGGRAEISWSHARVDAAVALGGMEGDRQALVQITLQLLIAFVVGVGGGLAVLLSSLRILGAGRWPLPNAVVGRPTRVLIGRCLTLRFGGLAVVAAALTLFVGLSGIRSIEFLWNTHLERRAAVAAPRTLPAAPLTSADVSSPPAAGSQTR